MKNDFISVIIGGMLGGGLALCALAYTMPPIIDVYEYKLHGLITPQSAEHFRGFISKRGEGDKVTIHIESIGGDVRSADKIKYYINKSKADITCLVDSHAYSAAARILMLCPKIEVAPHSSVMFHVSRICTKAKGMKCLVSAVVSPTFRKEAYDEDVTEAEQYRRVFGADQWEAFLAGKDVYIDGRDLMNRLTTLKEVQ